MAKCLCVSDRPYKIRTQMFGFFMPVTCNPQPIPSKITKFYHSQALHHTNPGHQAPISPLFSHSSNKNHRILSYLKQKQKKQTRTHENISQKTRTSPTKPKKCRKKKNTNTDTVKTRKKKKKLHHLHQPCNLRIPSFFFFKEKPAPEKD